MDRLNQPDVRIAGTRVLVSTVLDGLDTDEVAISCPSGSRVAARAALCQAAAFAGEPDAEFRPWVSVQAGRQPPRQSGGAVPDAMTVLDREPSIAWIKVLLSPAGGTDGPPDADPGPVANRPGCLTS